MNREEKIKKAEELCEQRTCAECPASGLFPEIRVCDFEEMDDEHLDVCFAILSIADKESMKDRVRKTVDKLFSPEPDAVHPQHYKLPGGMEVIDVEIALFGVEEVKAHCICTSAEYILRHKGKNGVEDIRKAHWWIEKFLELEGVSDENADY